MQAYYPASFEREAGCTETELLGWLPGAVQGWPLRVDAGEAVVAIEGGHLRLIWQALPPRRIALVTLPRLALRFDFEGVDDALRQRFMRRFDLHMQRGGG